MNKNVSGAHSGMSRSNASESNAKHAHRSAWLVELLLQWLHHRLRPGYSLMTRLSCRFPSPLSSGPTRENRSILVIDLPEKKEIGLIETAFNLTTVSKKSGNVILTHTLQEFLFVIANIATYLLKLALSRIGSVLQADPFLTSLVQDYEKI